MILVEELSESLDPWEAAQGLASLPGLLFLDSATREGPLDRYSFVTADPVRTIRSRGQQHGDPLVELATILARCKTEPVAGLPPFQGGIAGLWGYDLCHWIERLPRPRFDEFEVPDLAVGVYDWALSFDHQQKRTWLLSTGQDGQGTPSSERAAARVQQIKALLRERATELCLPCPAERVEPALSYLLPGRPGVVSNFNRAGYLQAVRRVIEYVHAGDCFQVNLSQRLLVPATEHPLQLYGRLRQRNPAPFSGYFDCGDFAIASASPERFLQVCNGEVRTRPIKGTRPRGLSPNEDEARQRELLASVKDRAENVMIVDLLRNDLGRVCKYGSVRVEALCRLESYRFVHHLVSEVRGQLRPEMGLIDLLRATFPGGSVTGAPKVRAMEIIAELEPTSRGAYCGCLGYLGFDGAMDTNLLIRTFTAGRGWVQFPVGGGIVAESTPESEYAETLHKAEGLLRALP